MDRGFRMKVTVKELMRLLIDEDPNDMVIARDKKGKRIYPTLYTRKQTEEEKEGLGIGALFG